MDGSVSDLFCCERCQQAWAARRVGAPVELVSPFGHLTLQRLMVEAARAREHEAELYRANVVAVQAARQERATRREDLGASNAPVTMGMDVDLSGNIAASFTHRVEGQPHVVYAVLDETHVWRDEQLAEFVRVHHEAMRARVASMLAGLSPAMVALGEAWRAAAVNIQAFHAALVEAGVVEKPLPVDQRARALALRKRRGTGPQPQQRAPRTINPRRTR